MRRPRLVRWLGGAAMLAVCYLPVSMLAFTTSPSALRVGGFDYGAVLWMLPGMLAVALIAPFVGRSRWSALWVLVPMKGLATAWDVGTSAAWLGRTRVTPSAPRPSRPPRLLLPRRPARTGSHAETLIREHLAEPIGR